MYVAYYPSPVGLLQLESADDDALCAVRLAAARTVPEHPCPVLTGAARQLAEYFAGRRQVFEVPLAAAGTPFQQRVWAALRTIPYGQTRSYGQVAAAIGSPKACRAVGMANNRNPIMIIVPCHRVIGADGSLVGYAGGVHIKEYLLRLEGVLPPKG